MGVNNQFHSVLAMNLPATGTVGDVWYTTDERLLYTVVGTGALVQLLVSVPVPVKGDQGLQGIPGPQGEQGPVLMYAGNWVFDQEYAVGSIVNANNSLYVANVRNIDNFPPSNPFWNLLGALAVLETELIIAVDGAGQVPTTGFRGFVTVPHNCVINSWTLLADQVGSASFDVKWSTYTDLPSTVSITNGTGPSLVSAQKAEGDTSGWSPVTFSSGDVLEFQLLTISDCNFLTLALQISSTN